MVALLPPEQGALVQKAIEAVTGGKPAADLGVDGWEAGRADALVAVCDHALASAPDDLISDSGSRQVLVHVDAGVLTGQDPEGRCHLESGPALSTATALKLGCDAELVTVIEKDGLPVDVGRKRRAISTRMRMALRSRDGSCRFPGCTVPARRTQGHHLEHWAHGGRTTLGNLLSLCEFHHHRLHEGAFQIKREGAKLHFLTRDGRALGPPGPGRVGSSCGGKAHLMHVAQMRRKDIDWRTPIAKDGSKVDHELTVWVLCTNTEHYRRQLASRDGPAQQPG